MISRSGEQVSITRDELRVLVHQCLDAHPGPLRRVLILPPDHTRLNSMAGPITAMIYAKLAPAGVQVVAIEGSASKVRRVGTPPSIGIV